MAIAATMQNKGRVIGITFIIALSWFKAAPSIIDAIKMFLGGG